MTEPDPEGSRIVFYAPENPIFGTGAGSQFDRQLEKWPFEDLRGRPKNANYGAKMAINGTSNKDQTSSSSDENTSDDEIKKNAAKLDLIQGKEKFTDSEYESSIRKQAKNYAINMVVMNHCNHMGR